VGTRPTRSGRRQSQSTPSSWSASIAPYDLRQTRTGLG
jgi:hypothetical protein